MFQKHDIKFGNYITVEKAHTSQQSNARNTWKKELYIKYVRKHELQCLTGATTHDKTFQTSWALDPIIRFLRRDWYHYISCPYLLQFSLRLHLQQMSFSPSFQFPASPTTHSSLQRTIQVESIQRSHLDYESYWHTMLRFLSHNFCFG